MKLSLHSNRAATDRDLRIAQQFIDRGRVRSISVEATYLCPMSYAFDIGLEPQECTCEWCEPPAEETRPRPLVGREKRTRKRTQRWLNSPLDHWLEVQREG